MVFRISRSIRARAIAACMTRWSITAATIRRCCCVSTRRSRCRSRTATPRRPASRWWRSFTTWSACCMPPWESTTPILISEQAKADWDGVPIALPRLASEIWDVIKHEDWVLTANTLQDWAYKLWDFDKPYRHPGQALGTGTQIGISLGVALAHRGSGRLVVDIQPDGDLLFDAGALWSAAKNNIPLLVVMYNNRAYYNDWEHQIHVAQHRGTPVERAYIAQDIAGPNPDFAGLAKSMGWYAEGPIEEPAEIAPALRRAVAKVKSGTPALVDTVVRPR